MGATRSTIDAVLKDIYLARMLTTINSSTILLSHIEQDTGMTTVSGKQAQAPVNIRGSQAIGARADGGVLPTAQSQTYVETVISYAFNYATIEVTHPAIASSKNKTGAWAKVLSSEMEGITRDVAVDQNRVSFGWGFGILGTCYATQGGGGSLSLVLDPGHQVKVGMLIDVWDGLTTATLRLEGLTVSAVVGDTCTIDTLSTWTNGWYVTRHGSCLFSGASSVCYEQMGLMGIIDDQTKSSGIGTFVTTLQGIARATYPEWNGNVMEGSTPGTARELTSQLLDEAILKPQETSGKKVDLGICTPTQFRRIGDLMVPDRRYTDSTELQGGFTALKWAGIPIAWDKDCPKDSNGYDMLFLLNTDELHRYELQDWDWDDEDGNILHRVETYAKYGATAFYYGNLGCTDPAAQLVIRDLANS